MTAQAVIEEIKGLPASEKAKVLDYFGAAQTPSTQDQTEAGFESRRRRYQTAEFTGQLVALLHKAKREALAERDVTPAGN